MARGQMVVNQRPEGTRGTMELNIQLIGLYVLPVLFWAGVLLYVRTLTGEVSQIQSAILFLLAFFLLASFVMLNVVVHKNVILLTLALVETLFLAGTAGLQIKKLAAKQ
jgi:hypothetical protein